MADIQHLASLTEEDIKFRYITPAIEQAGWQKNQIIDTAAVHHPCKGEDMYSYQPHYNYGIATDFNKECIYPKGSAIFVHVKGPKPYTGGCIAFDEDKMIEILKNCDMSLVITVKE